MYLHAYRMRDHLGLNEREALDTRITCELLLLPLPVFPIAVALMFAPTERVGSGSSKSPILVILVIAAEAAIFGYLAWAVSRTKRLEKQRAAVEAQMTPRAVAVTSGTPSRRRCKLSPRFVLINRSRWR